jgi:hypothetical protein
MDAMKRETRALKASSYPYSFILFILQEAEVLFNPAQNLIQSQQILTTPFFL